MAIEIRTPPKSVLPPQLNLVKNMLTMGCINPYKQNKLVKIGQIIAVIASGTLLILMALNPILTWQGIETLGKAVYIPGIFIIFCEQLVFVTKHKDFKALFEKLNDLWPWDKFGPTLEKELQAYSNKGYIIIKIFFAMFIVNCVNIVVTPILATEPKLPYPQYYYCNVQNLSCYVISFSFQVYNLIFIQFPVVFGFDMFFLSLVVQVHIAFELLNAALKQGELTTHNHHMLKEIVDQHNIILDMVGAYESLTSTIFLIKYTTSLGQIVFCFYMLAVDGIPDKERFINYGVLVMTVIMMIYMYSYGGTIIYYQSLSVADAAGHVKWYLKGQTNLRKDLSMLICRAQKAQRITAAHYKVDMEAFIDTMKNALSVSTLLIKLSKEDHA